MVMAQRTSIRKIPSRIHGTERNPGRSVGCWSNWTNSSVCEAEIKKNQVTLIVFHKNLLCFRVHDLRNQNKLARTSAVKRVIFSHKRSTCTHRLWQGKWIKLIIIYKEYIYLCATSNKVCNNNMTAKLQQPNTPVFVAFCYSSVTCKSRLNFRLINGFSQVHDRMLYRIHFN